MPQVLTILGVLILGGGVAGALMLAHELPAGTRIPVVLPMALSSIISGVLLIAFAEVVALLETIAKNTAPLQRFDRKPAAPLAVKDGPLPDGAQPTIVHWHEWRGRQVREMSDGWLELDTLTGPKRFSDWDSLKAYVS